jgi:hypothetical protein
MSNLKVNSITSLDGGAPIIPGGGSGGSGADAWARGNRCSIGGIGGRAISPTAFLPVPMRTSPTATTLNATIYVNDGISRNPSRTMRFRVSSTRINAYYDAGGDSNFPENGVSTIETNFTLDAEL